MVDTHIFTNSESKHGASECVRDLSLKFRQTLSRERENPHVVHRGLLLCMFSVCLSLTDSYAVSYWRLAAGYTISTCICVAACPPPHHTNVFVYVYVWDFGYRDSVVCARVCVCVAVLTQHVENARREGGGSDEDTR